MRQRLIRAAHDAESDMQVAALHEGRDDGVKRPLAAGENVGMVRLQREPRATVLQQESHAIDGDSGTELRVHALDPTGYVAVLVDDREIGGITADWLTWRHHTIRLVWIDQGRAPAG